MIITGGEPLTNWPVVDYLVSQVEGTKVLFTNATLMTPEIASKLLDSKVNVVVSIDGPACLNDSVRTGPGGWPTYHAISRGIRAMQDAGLEYGISMVCAKHNLSFLSESAEFLIEEFSPVSIGINLPHYVEYAKALVDVDPIEYAKQLCVIFEIAKKYRIYVDQIARRLRPLVTEQFLFRDCSAYGGKQVHFPGGVASNCINMVQEPPTDFSIWQDRMPLNIEDCQGCYAIGICGGGCFFDALHRVGDGYKIDPRHCDVIKTLLEYLIWDIWKTCQVSRPSKSEMFSAYEWILSRNSKLNISIGHDESDAQKRSRSTVV
jgi:radical SAM protein with 4Fe4S-binding SPASM domain